MGGIHAKLTALYSLEQLSAGTTALHRLHPLVKLIAVSGYLACVVSFPVHSLLRLLPYALLALLVMEAGDIPFRLIGERAVLALPFCIFAGVGNLLWDRGTAVVLAGFPVTGGMLSFAVLLARAFLCAGAVLILMALTPFPELAGALRRLHLPELMILLLEMIYRYLAVLSDEAASMLVSFRLRSGREWPSPKEFGPFAGQLLLQSNGRAARVYAAMQCRLYGANASEQSTRPLSANDLLALFLSLAVCVGLRVFDVLSWIGGMLV